MEASRIAMEPVSMGLDSEDLAGQLRRQIAQVTHEKEQAKLELEVLKRTIDSHLMRFNSVLAGSDVSFDRLSSAIQSFDADLKGKLDVETRHGTEGTYEVLRHSLNDALRRSQEKNNDMLRMADANEELMNTLKTLKSANKRLVEDVQRQTEELGSLTQQRLLDMENLQRLEEVFRQEEATWEHEAQRAVDDERTHCQLEYNRMRDRLTAKLDTCWEKAKQVAGTIGGVHSAQGELKADMQGFVQNLHAGMQKLERDVLERIHQKARHLEDEQSRLRDMEHGLQVKLKAEREIRESEGEAWRSRHQGLTRDLDELVSRREREVTGLQAHVQSLNETREAEAKAMAQDRQNLHDKIEASVKDIALVEAKKQTSRRKAAQLEAHLSQAEAERNRLEDMAQKLREQIEESETLLADAVRSNDTLRHQMESQRDAAHAENERDLKTCKEMFEKRLEAAQHSWIAEQDELAKKIRHLEEQLGLKAGEVQAAQEMLNERSRCRDALSRDVMLWKAQHELAQRTKTDLERELSQFRQESINGELRRLQAQHDELSVKKGELESKRTAVLDEAKEAQRTVKARELRDADRAMALRDSHSEACLEAERVKLQVAEAERSHARAKAESATLAQQASERRDALEREIQRVTAEMEAEKRDYERKIQAERLNCENLRESFEKLRSEHRSSYKAAFEGPVQQITALEGAISEIQRSSDAELAAMRQRSEKYRLRIGEVESELHRVQGKLQATEQEVQEATARVSLSKAKNRAAREALEREKSQRQDELHRLQRSIAEKAEALRSLTRTSEEVRRKMLRNIEEENLANAKRLEPLPLEDSQPLSPLDRREGLQRSLASMDERREGLFRDLPGLRR